MSSVCILLLISSPLFSSELCSSLRPGISIRGIRIFRFFSCLSTKVSRCGIYVTIPCLVSSFSSDSSWYVVLSAGIDSLDSCGRYCRSVQRMLFVTLVADQYSRLFMTVLLTSRILPTLVVSCFHCFLISVCIASLTLRQSSWCTRDFSLFLVVQ